MKTIEKWKIIDGFEDYEVSTFGRIRHNNKILSLSKNTSGYFKVNLYNNSKSKTVYVHRIVAKAFISNVNNLNEINHIDENKLNNHVDNLEWCDTYYNNKYGTKTLRQSKAISKKILVIDVNNNINRYNSINEAAIALNCSKSNISRVINRPTKRCKG